MVNKPQRNPIFGKIGFLADFNHTKIICFLSAKSVPFNIAVRHVSL